MAREIPLTRGMVALVDDEDFERVAQYKWTTYKAKRTRTFYAYRTINVHGRRTCLFLHRFLLDAPKGLKVDHVNGNGLDNRRENLRFATTAENVRSSARASNNTSGFKGVSWHKHDRKWEANITFNGKRRYLGSFTCPIEAAKVYDAAAREQFGDFARVNFPREDEAAA